MKGEWREQVGEMEDLESLRQKTFCLVLGGMEEWEGIEEGQGRVVERKGLGIVRQGL